MNPPAPSPDPDVTGAIAGAGTGTPPVARLDTPGRRRVDSAGGRDGAPGAVGTGVGTGAGPRPGLGAGADAGSRSGGPGSPVSLSDRQRDVWAGVVGVVSALAALAAAELTSLFLGGIGNPVLVVGSLVVDVVPAWFKSLVIDLFGTADKIALFVVLGLVVLALAVAAGVLRSRRGRLGELLIAVVTAIAIVAAVTRADATAMHAIPAVVAGAAGVLTLRGLSAKLEDWRTAPPIAVGTGYERRSFLSFTIAVGVVSAIAAAGGRVATAAATVVADLRSAIRLPAADAPAPTIPPGATLDVPGISAFVTPNDEFYRIDTALQVPSVDPRDWTLRVTGMVEQEVEIGFDELLAQPLVERLVTLACVSNEVGGGLIGNALWLGYPIRDLLARARPMVGADMVLSTSSDGFTASTPLEVLVDPNTDALLAVGMNGEPLPLQHGFPVRMVVPGLYGYVSATKWVVELEVTRFADRVAYWTPRGWSERGPIKLSSRIDTPRNGFAVQPGTVAVAGVAWAQHTGISRVEVRVDGGEWREASLAREVTVDSWLQWSYDWNAGRGSHEIEVRATDSNGFVQTEERAPVAPNGSTGLHGITITVS